MRKAPITSALTDDEFSAAFQKHGPQKLSRLINQNVRTIYRRREHIEARTGRQLKAPDEFRSTRLAESHAPVLKYEVKNGVVLIGSDAHIWPGPQTTAMRAFVKFCKELRPSLAIMNGDVLDFPQISRHPPIGHNKLPDLAEEIEAAQEQLHQIELATPRSCKLVWTLGNHDCLDTATECLTQRGWLKYDQIERNDKILSWVDGAAVWTQINDIVKRPHAGKLIRVEKTRMSMAVTPNHRVLLKRLNWRSKRYDILEYRHANDLPSSFDMPVAGQIENPEYNISDDQLSLVGWLLTDGCYGQYNISIYQSKPAGIEKITGVLDRLGISYSRYDRQRERKVVCGRMLLKDPLPSSHFHIKAADSRSIKEFLPAKGRLPDWARLISARQFSVLLDALVDGDGVWDGRNPSAKTCCVIYGKEEILSSIQAVACCHGWRARLTIDNRGDYRLCLTKEPKLRIDKPEVFEEEYNGVVWCLNVPHSNFMVRRNGCAFFTGNCRFETRLAVVAPEYAKLHGHSLKDHFPAWNACWRADINDDVTVKHRHKGGTHATHNSTLWAGRTMVTGHLHSSRVTALTDYSGTRYGVDTGCLADPSARAFVDYTEAGPLNWRSGFGVLTFKDGKLLPPELVTVWDHEPNAVTFRGEVIRV